MKTKILPLLLLIAILPGLIFAQAKVKVQYSYEVKKTGPDILFCKTLFAEDGKKIKTTEYDGNWEFSTTTYEYNENNLLVKSTTKWYESKDIPVNEPLIYTTTFTYDKDGRELGFRYDGDYSTDVSPNVFENVYDKGDKPVKRLEYFENSEVKKKLYITTTFKYDDRGNKIEEKRIATDYDYEDLETFVYDNDNRLTISILTFDREKQIFIFKYDFY